MKEELIAHAVPAEKVHCIPLFSPDFVPLTVPPAEKVISGNLLLIGRLLDVKGGEYAIRALPIASGHLKRELKLTIAGEGPEQERMRTLAATLNVSVHFTGWLNAKERKQVMGSSDLLVVPSLWPEPFGLVGIEAGCFGLPSVAYAVGGITDWLIPGFSGELASGDPPTPDGLAAAIARAFSSVSRYNELRSGAWKMAQRFSLPAHLEQLIDLFQSTLHELVSA